MGRSSPVTLAATTLTTLTFTTFGSLKTHLQLCNHSSHHRQSHRRLQKYRGLQHRSYQNHYHRLWLPWHSFPRLRSVSYYFDWTWSFFLDNGTTNKYDVIDYGTVSLLPFPLLIPLRNTYLWSLSLALISHHQNYLLFSLNSVSFSFFYSLHIPLIFTWKTNIAREYRDHHFLSFKIQPFIWICTGNDVHIHISISYLDSSLEFFSR